MSDLDDDQTPAPKNGPLMIEGPKAIAGSAEIPIIDLEPLDTAAHQHASGDDIPSSEDDAPSTTSRWHLTAPLAAGVAFAIVLGALAGAATTAGLMREAAPPPGIAAADATRDLQKTVAQLSSELATLKSGITTAQRSASAQFGKLAERLDRTEKAQAEPTAKLAKIQESLDKLDKRQQVAAVATVPATASDITGSVTPKDAAHPPVADGWRLRDFYAGHAIVESRNGTLFEVAVGSNLPGLGKVESVKRENGKVTVLTKNGMITAALEQRRAPYYPPYRY
jgi:hypothetical protein